MFMVNWCSPRSQGNSDGERVVFSTTELEKLSISYKKKRLTEFNMLRCLSQIQLKTWFYKFYKYFINKVLLDHSHTHSFYILPIAAFTVKWQSWVTVIKTFCSAKQKVFTFWSFTEKLPTPDLQPYFTTSTKFN